MSLDVYLDLPAHTEPLVEKIFIREDGMTKAISPEEWSQRYPGREPFTAQSMTHRYSSNITHNLGGMAKEAGIYQHLWRPEEIGITHAKQLIEPLHTGLALMKSDPARFRAFDAPNGWGTYEQFIPWIQEYLAACEANPEATVSVSR